MGSDKARKRRARQLEAQFEKKSMRRAHFSLGGGVGKQSGRVEQVGHMKDDGMTNALRKMLAMKEGRNPNDRRRGQYEKKGERKQDKVGKEVSQGDDHKASLDPKEGTMDQGDGRNSRKKVKRKGKEEEKKVSASKLKRKAFMKKKGKKTNDEDSYEPGPGPASFNTPVFGEQADRPIEATLKRRHWVDSETPKPLTLSMKNVGSRMDSKALAALYRTSRNKNGKKHVATMDTLKQLVKSTAMDG